jgi:LPXTG-motif cell wall-anchored protein
LRIPTEQLEDGKQLQQHLDANQRTQFVKMLEELQLRQKELADETTKQKQTTLAELQEKADRLKQLEQEQAQRQEELRRLEARRREAERQRLEEQRRAHEELLHRLEEQKRAQEEQHRRIAEEQRQIANELAKKLEAQQQRENQLPTPVPPGTGNAVADLIPGIAGPLGVPLGPWAPLQELPWTGGPLDTIVPHDEDLVPQVTTILAAQGLLFPKGTTPLALTGFEPKQSVVLAIESTLTPLAEGVADDEGVVRVEVELPDGIAGGAHTLYAVAGDRATIVPVQVADIDDVVDAVLSVVVLASGDADPADDPTERVVTTAELPETGRGLVTLLALALAALLAGTTTLLLRRTRRPDPPVSA